MQRGTACAGVELREANGEICLAVIVTASRQAQMAPRAWTAWPQVYLTQREH